MIVRSLPSTIAALLAALLLSASPACHAMTTDDAVAAVFNDPSLIAEGEELFSEDFEGENPGRWQVDAGWKLVDGPDGAGKCMKVTASAEDHEDLVLNTHVPVMPGHPIGIFWKTRFVSGATPLYIRVDYFDETGKTGKPYARQMQSAQGSKWTQNALMVSDWFPEYTRQITVHFHHGPGAATTSLLDDVKIVDLTKPAAALLTAELDRAIALAESLSERDTTLPASPVNDYWKTVIATQLTRARKQLEGIEGLEQGSLAYSKAAAGPMSIVRRLADAVDALKAGKVATRKVLAYSTRPVTSQMILPRDQAIPGTVSNHTSIVAAPGEYEPVSLALWAAEDIRQLQVAVGDLTGPEGVISRDNIDVKWVKCWYQGGSAPHGIPVHRDKRVLVAELLLNDDSLVRVDLDERRNFLKLARPDGPEYVAIDSTEIVPWGNKYTLEEYPVKDSPTLLPTNVPSAENKQVWLTVKVPEDAKPGVYTGSVQITSSGASLGEVGLKLRVLPFTLPSPKTHYDPAEDFTYSLYYWGELDPKGKGTIGYKVKSEEQFRAELQYMYDRNIVGPAMIISPSIVYDDEPLFRKHLQIMQETGMAGRPLVMADSGLVGNPVTPEELELLKDRVRKTLAIAAEYDFPMVYFYALDEATNERLMSQMVAWDAVHEAGGRIFVSGYAGHLEKVGHVLDLFNRAGPSDRADPAGWHAQGHKIWNYANPQTPVEDPAVYRRNYGLFLWGLDFDGACTYCFIDSSGRPWNDFDGKSYRDHNVAYPTVDGVVATLAMEGFREGADDVKYATLLGRLINEATGAKAATAKEAGEWLEAQDFGDADLDEVRARMIEYILALSTP